MKESMRAMRTKLIVMIASVVIYVVSVGESGVAFATDPALQPGNGNDETGTAIYLPLIRAADVSANDAAGDNSMPEVPAAAHPTPQPSPRYSRAVFATSNRIWRSTEIRAS